MTCRHRFPRRGSGRLGHGGGHRSRRCETDECTTEPPRSPRFITESVLNPVVFGLLL